MSPEPSPTSLDPNTRTPPAVEHPHQAAERLAHLDADERIRLFRDLAGDERLAVFPLFDPALEAELLAALPSDEGLALVEGLDPDDRARLVPHLSPEAAEQVLRELSPREQELTGLLLTYPDESAGRIMSPEFLALRAGLSVAEALADIRERGRYAETVYVLPVVDPTQRLVGMLSLEDLVLARPDSRVGDLMETEFETVRADADQEAVARLIASTDALALPVVDAEDRIVGLVTVDDAFDVLDVEGGEDLARTGGSEPLGRPYFSASIATVARSRVVWLLMLGIAATLTVNVLDAFQGMVDEVVALALFIPLLIGIGGNSGAQSATTIVRAMATDDVRPADLMRVMLREARVGLLLGLIVAAIAFPAVWLFVGRALALVVSLTLVTICTLAAVVGSTMPLLARRLGIDPAVVSAPVVTTVVDATGLLVYFLIARAVLLG